MATRKKYSKEYKLDAISMVLEQEYSQEEVARSLDIRVSMLNRWVRKYQSGNYIQAFLDNGNLTAEQAEIRRLKAENKRLKMEKEILGKVMERDGLLCQRNAVKYAFVACYKQSWPVDLMCKVMCIRRNGYYQYMKRQKQVDRSHHLKLLNTVRENSPS